MISGVCIFEGIYWIVRCCLSHSNACAIIEEFIPILNNRKGGVKEDVYQLTLL